MPNAKVTLERPIIGHEAVRELEFREPGYVEYMQLGEPFMWVPTGGDQFRRIDDMPTVAKYAALLLLDGSGKKGDALVLEQVKNVIDARKITEAIIGFFRDGEASAS